MKLFKLKATDIQAAFGTLEEPLSPPLWLFAQANDSSAFYYIAENSYTNENLTEVDVDTLDKETVYTTYDGSQNQMPCSNRLEDAIKMYRQKELDNLTVEYNGNTFHADEVSQDRLLRAKARLDATAQTATEWKTKSDVFVTLTIDNISEILASANTAQQAIWIKYA